ncbi:MAG: hypothetical protein Q8L29_01660 [archaeon]|nr:hypothetical protein [archaeon]
MDSKKLAIWSFILGLVGFLPVFILFLDDYSLDFSLLMPYSLFYLMTDLIFLSPVVAIISIVLSNKALKIIKSNPSAEGSGFARAGAIFSIVDLIGSIYFIAIIVIISSQGPFAP